mgnify:CR=1 FL=1
MQKKAQRLTQYCDGMFNEASIYDAGPQVFIDGCVFGTGALRIFIDGIEPMRIRRMPPSSSSTSTRRARPAGAA